jgi:hypothetical protein
MYKRTTPGTCLKKMKGRGKTWKSKLKMFTDNFDAQ